MLGEISTGYVVLDIKVDNTCIQVFKLNSALTVCVCGLEVKLHLLVLLWICCGLVGDYLGAAASCRTICKIVRTLLMHTNIDLMT